MSRLISGAVAVAVLLLTANAGGAEQRSTERPTLLAQMCKHKDYQTCIRDACGPPAPSGPAVAPNQKYVPSPAEVTQDACYKKNAEPCRAANNCPH